MASFLSPGLGIVIRKDVMPPFCSLSPGSCKKTTRKYARSGGTPPIFSPDMEDQPVAVPSARFPINLKKAVKTGACRVRQGTVKDLRDLNDNEKASPGG